MPGLGEVALQRVDGGLVMKPARRRDLRQRQGGLLETRRAPGAGQGVVFSREQQRSQHAQMHGQRSRVLGASQCSTEVKVDLDAAAITGRQGAPDLQLEPLPSISQGTQPAHGWTGISVHT